MEDLDKLIASANEEITNNWEQDRTNKQQLSQQNQSLASRLIWVVLPVFLVTICYLVIVRFIPISEKTIITDLNTALDTAQASIEDFRQLNGELPSHIPAPSLMGLVYYQSVENGYILSISMNGKSLTRNHEESTVNNNE